MNMPKMGAELHHANSNSNPISQQKPAPMSVAPPPSSTQLITKIPKILPHERVFPIQIGSELFKLSGASISSDGKSHCPMSCSGCDETHRHSAFLFLPVF